MSLNGGYAMIKYNSTQEELQIAYRSKKPVLFYDENQRSHWAVIEETATESVDEETQEPITLYEYSYRLLDEKSGGSEVHLYRHSISLKGRNPSFETIPVEVRFDILLSTNTALTYEDVRMWLMNNLYDNRNRFLSVQSGKIIDIMHNISWHIIIGLYGDEQYINIMLQYINGESVGTIVVSFFNQDKSCTDTITQIF